MTQSKPLTIRNAELDGLLTDIRIENGRITDIGSGLTRSTQEIEGRGGALIPGLIDHHIHLFATAARLNSVDLSSIDAMDVLLSTLLKATTNRPDNDWVRAVGYDDTHLGLLSRDDLDRLNITNPVRVQDRTGALWVLNTPALDRALKAPPPPCVERAPDGRPTGRIWRGDAWLRNQINSSAPSLLPLSQKLSSYGIIGVTDTGATNGPQEARLLAHARAKGDLLQSLYLMSGTDIPPSDDYEIGPLKILLDEHDLPPLDEITKRMREARQLKRSVAVHCVTAAELVVTLAAFEEVGARHGDRIEHGGIIPKATFESIRALDLTIVTQPNFAYDRGDRYLHTVDPIELPDLYRLNSLCAAGIRMAAGSDAPYGGCDPWRAIRAATDRKTKDGKILGTNERITTAQALSLYSGSAHAPGGPARKISVGKVADLCLLTEPLASVLAAPDAEKVAATIARGELIYMAN